MLTVSCLAWTVPKIIDLTLDDIDTGLTSGKFTSVDLVRVYHARIQEVDDTFRSVIELNPDALQIAKELDEEFQTTKLRRRLVV
jgi:amidase